MRRFGSAFFSFFLLFYLLFFFLSCLLQEGYVGLEADRVDAAPKALMSLARVALINGSQLRRQVPRTCAWKNVYLLRRGSFAAKAGVLASFESLAQMEELVIDGPAFSAQAIEQLIGALLKATSLRKLIIRRAGKPPLWFCLSF